MGTNTGIGIGIGIPFKNNALGGDRPYLPPELKARLIGVWDNYGKKNTDADRNIIKNKIPNAGGDLEILNAAYKLNSGFGEYKEDFTSWRIYPNIEVTDNVITTNGNFNSTWFIYKHSSESKINEMNIKVSGIPKGGKIFYFYISDETDNLPIKYTIPKDGIYHLPESKINNNRVSVGFTVENRYDWNNIRIEQIPSFEGAFVTDGKDDFITSTKTVQEMLGGSNEITVVSMIHLVQTPAASSEKAYTNQIRTGQNYLRNYVTDNGKTGIYGYTCKGNNVSVINNILGDKNDYIVENKSWNNLAKFSVIGYEDNGTINELDQVAWYWTIIANKVLTTDQINQVIAYFNLDRTLKPDIRCNIERQGITNDNHADFNNKLIDYSGNGRDIQMYNLAWKGGSGIAAKQYETFKDWTSESSSTSIIKQIDEFTRIVESTTNGYWVSRIRRDSDLDKVYSPINVYLYQDNNFLVHECKYEIDGVKYAIPINEPVGKGYHKLEMYTKDRYTELPENAENVVLSEWYFPKSTKGSIKYSIIPSCKGGILLDGINDFGKVIDMPIYKDYTFIIDREIISIGDIFGIVASKSESSTDTTKQGAFLFEYLGAPNNITTWSFYNDNHKVGETDFTKSISYQSKYSYNGKELTAGEAKDSDKLWLGTIRDRDSRFFNGAIYSLMSFPYSMSKFLIERQLKKYKLGTLYPNMVEFRPIIKSNIDILKINYWDKDWNVVNVGDYISVGNDIKTNITVPNGYKVSKVTSDAFDNITIEKSSTDFIYDVKFYGIKKSPQKIGITIEQDENYILFNPVINSNYDNYKLTFHLREYEKLINIGDYIPKGTYIRANLYLKNNIDELVTFTFNGVNIDYVKSPVLDTAYNIGQIYNYDSPQEVNITIDEYIRYEDIVQPYPSFVKLENLDRTHTYTWGDKLKVGDIIRYNSSKNLLEGAYTLRGQMECNGVYVFDNNQQIVVTKEMVFAWSHSPIWNIDDNEPKCILSPRLLRIPNSSYKILGYIPDISGHGNHGVIHNSAYAQMSGANGYGTNLGNWSINSANTGKIITQREEHLEYEVLSADKNILFYNTKIENDTFVIYTSVNTNIVYSKESDIIANIPANTPTKVVCPKIGTILLKTNETPTVGNIITVKQYGIYEGAYCFDGVDDFVTIPTITGGKQVLMKVNWQSITGMAILYDQRTNGGFAIFNKDYDTNENKVPAYRARNIGGNTYIDGILNEYIYASQLQNITHNIVELHNPKLNIGTLNPKIGSSYLNSSYAQMSLYDFMLFDEISTEAKIKELNTYIGITPKVTLPNYYWDNYGKKNTDANRGHVDEQVSLQKTGTSVNPLENFNISYEGMSGYNGYPVVFGASKTWESLSDVYGYTSNVTNTTIHVTHAEHAGNGLLFSYVKKDGALANIKEIPAFRVTVGGLEGNSKFGYRYLATEDATEETLVYLGNGTHELAKSFAPTEALLDLTRNVWVGIFITPMIEGEVVFDCDITIEVLPEYENGLAYDGVSDFSQNTEIEVVEDFTFLVKGSLLKGLTGSGGCIARKGDKKHYDTGGYPFIYCFDSPIESYRNSYYSFGKSFVPSKEIVAPPLIGYMTKTNVNGETTTFGTNSDIKGIIFGNWSSGYMNMVIYKSIFYTKTISLLEINFLKNLMEKDEIIDINHPIFISNTEDESNTSQDT